MGKGHHFQADPGDEGDGEHCWRCGMTSPAASPSPESGILRIDADRRHGEARQAGGQVLLRHEGSKASDPNHLRQATRGIPRIQHEIRGTRLENAQQTDRESGRLGDTDPHPIPFPNSQGAQPTGQRPCLLIDFPKGELPP